MSTAFLQAAVILLREGLEAMLVIAALAGYLNKVGAGHRIQALYGGALTAVGASIMAAWPSRAGQCQNAFLNCAR
jgi:high-affinity iron transporter